MNIANSAPVGAHEQREAAIAVCLTHRSTQSQTISVGATGVALDLAREPDNSVCQVKPVIVLRGQASLQQIKRLCFLVLLCLSPLAHAFDLQELSEQLARPVVVRGNFIQEKHLRALPTPLISKGRFVLAKEFGLLWLLNTPLKQDYRISPAGIARRDAANGWQLLPNKSAGAEQNRLFLAVLQGNSSGLQRDFELQLKGDANAWHLTLTPRSLLLQQIFKQINIDGGELVQRIELLETQGDSTLLKMIDSQSVPALSDAERADFAN